MKHIYGMSAAESEVMEKLWDSEECIRQSQLLSLLEEEGKAWKRQTLNTFLARLEEKQLVKRENRLVRAVYSRDDYNFMQLKEVIDQSYGGKLSNFVAAFCQKNGIDGEDAEALSRILEKY